jgi:DNA adenine methylase
VLTSPLRYPGGKAKLFNFFIELLKENCLFPETYCEPYAGGAGLALRLLSSGFVDNICLNDIDSSICAFWTSALHNTNAFCNLIDECPLTVTEWHKQKLIWDKGDTSDLLQLGFATYFLNRTNRSGIIDGAGPIGGYTQQGTWKIDARLPKQAQIENLIALSKFRSQIKISNLDACEFLNGALTFPNSLVYLDPPYFVKGSKLYKNFYDPEDHAQIAALMEKNREANWVVTYDDVPEIRQAYTQFTPVTYSLNYSAGQKTLGHEVMFLSDALRLPAVSGYQVAA